VVQLFEPRAFVAHPHPAVVDDEMKGPLLAGAAPATAEQGHRDAGLLQHAHGQPTRTSNRYITFPSSS
jgi:hypothetical protein